MVCRIGRMLISGRRRLLSPAQCGSTAPFRRCRRGARRCHVLSPEPTSSRLGAFDSWLSSTNRIPAWRNFIEASSLMTYVRFGKTAPGECRNNTGSALAPSAFVSWITTFMDPVLGSRMEETDYPSIVPVSSTHRHSQTECANLMFPMLTIQFIRCLQFVVDCAKLTSQSRYLRMSSCHETLGDPHD